MIRTFSQFNDRWRDLNRTPRRQYWVKHLIECRPRPVLEASLETKAGTPLDEVLECYAKLQPEIFEAVGADTLPINEVAVVDGGRR
jgi:hypothetical protein